MMILSFLIYCYVTVIYFYHSVVNKDEYTGWPKKVSHKVGLLFISLPLLLTDVQNFFTAAFCEKFVVKWLLNIPPHRNCIASSLHYLVKYKMRKIH